MGYFSRGIVVACALLAQAAQAAPIHYKFNGTVQQTVFDPVNPFPFAISPGAEIVGRVNFDTAATDLAADDPNVGAYAFTQGPGSPYLLALELHDAGSLWGFSFDSFTVGVVNGVSRDQLTIFGQRGDPDGLGDYATFEMRFDYAATMFDSDALPTIPLDAFISSSFALTGAVNRDGQLYQYELMGTPDSITVPEPGSMGLVLLGAGAVLVSRRRRHPAVPAIPAAPH